MLHDSLRNALRRAVALLALCAVVVPTGAASFDHDYRDFASALAAHVQEGRVDYAALRRDRAALDRHVAAVSAVDAAQLASFSREQRLAYWINVYNAFVLVTVLDAYPIERGSLVGLAFPANSIWQIPGAFKGTRFLAGGRRVSLDDIEHKIVRPEFREPRIHMALVCAARGCPILRSEPYTATTLERMLDESTRRYLADRVHGARYDAAQNQLFVSSIFKWFKEDFVAPSGGNAAAGVREFIARHSPDAASASAIRTRMPRIRYLDYDWTLNDK